MLREMLAVATTLCLAACAVAPPSASPPAARATAIGPVLTDTRGMTLYTYDADPAGRSKCYGLCAIAWPPATAAAAAQLRGAFTLVRRADATQQWAYKGAPLYGFFRDAKPGDTAGDGDEGVWHVARP